VKISKQEGKLTLQRRSTDNPTNAKETAEGEVKANKASRGGRSGNKLTITRLQLTKQN
jgi:hypothetical protein